MSLWIPVTLCAALFQTLRFMLQKWLSTARLSAEGATFARFAYSAPLLMVVLAIWFGVTGHPVPSFSPAFWAFALSGGAGQILATVFVVLLFKERNFAVGITFKNAEVVLTAFIGLVLLGEMVSWGGLAAILVGLVAIVLLSTPPEGAGTLWQNLSNRASGLGLGAGLLFAISAVGYRGASLQIDEPSAALRASVTLAAVTVSQMIAMGLWLLWRDRAQLRAVWDARGSAVWIGITSLAGSFCWFLAFTLQTAAYVRAMGQVELVFSLAASVLFFRETITRREIAGIGLLGLSILILILSI